jgi:outer membrane protein assembly factor BamB
MSMCISTPASAQWTQWGGPTGDFVAQANSVSPSWSEAGPKEIWKRDLGEGYSAILIDGGRLYTMYRTNGEEAVIALDAASGKTVWEHRYDSDPAEGHEVNFGSGPRSTPLLIDGRLYTIGVAGVMHCLDAESGKPIWKHDLWKEFGGNHLNHGYSSSPIAYQDTIITLVGGEGASIVAFKKSDGSVAWKNLDFKNSYSTPKVITLGGKDHLVTFMANEAIGVDPTNGELQWRYEIGNQWGQNVSPPMWDAKSGTLFISTPEAGARGLKLTANGGKVDVEEAWNTRKIQFYHVTSVAVGDYVYGSTGTMGPTFLAGVNVKTGEVVWRKRGFAKANCVYADGKLIVLDEEGNIALATATPDDLTVLAKSPLLKSKAWTVPTVAGSQMFVRDQETIRALELKAGA